MKQLYSFTIIFFLLISNSCSNDTDRDTQLIDNEYTAIVLSLCDEIGEYTFRTSDTYYFDLNSDSPLKTFVFITDVMCGFAGGSCGASIKVYKKNGSDYKIAYDRCGFNVKKLDDSNFGINLFTLEVRIYPGGVDPYSKLLTISWDGEQFNETMK